MERTGIPDWLNDLGKVLAFLNIILGIALLIALLTIWDPARGSKPIGLLIAFLAPGSLIGGAISSMVGQRWWRLALLLPEATLLAYIGINFPITLNGLLQPTILNVVLIYFPILTIITMIVTMVLDPELRKNHP